MQSKGELDLDIDAFPTNRWAMNWSSRHPVQTSYVTDWG